MHSITLSNLLNSTTSSYLTWSFPDTSINQNKSDEVLQKFHLATEKYGDPLIEDICLKRIKSIGNEVESFTKDPQSSLKDEKCDFSDDTSELNKLLIKEYDRFLKKVSLNENETDLGQIFNLNRVILKAKDVTPNLCNKFSTPFYYIRKTDREKLNKQAVKKLMDQYLKPSFIKQCQKSLETEFVYLNHIESMKDILFLFLDFYHEEKECQKFAESYRQRFKELLEIAPEDKRKVYEKRMLKSLLTVVKSVVEKKNRPGKYFKHNAVAQNALEEKIDLLREDVSLVDKDTLKTKRSAVNDEKIKALVTTKASTTTKAPVTITTEAPTTTETSTTATEATTTTKASTTETSTTTKAPVITETSTTATEATTTEAPTTTKAFTTTTEAPTTTKAFTTTTEAPTTTKAFTTTTKAPVTTETSTTTTKASTTTKAPTTTETSTTATETTTTTKASTTETSTTTKAPTTTETSTTATEATTTKASTTTKTPVTITTEAPTTTETSTTATEATTTTTKASTTTKTPVTITTEAPTTTETSTTATEATTTTKASTTTKTPVTITTEAPVITETSTTATEATTTEAPTTTKAFTTTTKAPVITETSTTTTTKASTMKEAPVITETSTTTTKAPVITETSTTTTEAPNTITKVMAASAVGSFGIFSALFAFIGWMVFGKKKPQKKDYIPVSTIETKVEESIV